jgi:hypothetical protein
VRYEERGQEYRDIEKAGKHCVRSCYSTRNKPASSYFAQIHSLLCICSNIRVPLNILTMTSSMSICEMRTEENFIFKMGYKNEAKI